MKRANILILTFLLLVHVSGLALAIGADSVEPMLNPLKQANVSKNTSTPTSILHEESGSGDSSITNPENMEQSEKSTTVNVNSEASTDVPEHYSGPINADLRGRMSAEEADSKFSSARPDSSTSNAGEPAATQKPDGTLMNDNSTTEGNVLQEDKIPSVNGGASAGDNVSAVDSTNNLDDKSTKGSVTEASSNGADSTVDSSAEGSTNDAISADGSTQESSDGISITDSSTKASDGASTTDGSIKESSDGANTTSDSSTTDDSTEDSTTEGAAIGDSVNTESTSSEATDNTPAKTSTTPIDKKPAKVLPKYPQSERKPVIDEEVNLIPKQNKTIPLPIEDIEDEDEVIKRSSPVQELAKKDGILPKIGFIFVEFSKWLGDLVQSYL